MSDESEVIPIKPEVIPLGTEAQALVEHAVASFHSFIKANGHPVGFAMVIVNAEGTAETFYQMLEGSPGWRSTLALAGAMLTAEAVKPS